MKVHVFFDGAGGSSCGIEQAGHETVGFEVWAPTIETRRANGGTVVEIDLSDPAQDHLIPDDATVAWFSPPCQPFSAAGDGDGEFDDRDGLPWTLRIIEARRYDLVFVENVKGLTFAKHADHFGRFLRALTGLGYEWEWRVLNCADYGVPQTRERCIVIARRDDGPITWPMPTHTETAGMFTGRWVTMAEALGWGGDRPSYTVLAGGEPFGSGVRTALLHHNQRGKNGELIVTDVTDRPAPTVGTKVEGQWWLERPATTIAGDQRVMAPGRHDPDQSGSQMADAVKLTIRELATLQGFPADYQFCGTKTAQAKQIGNAVPPALARVLIEANVPNVQEVAA